MKHTARYFIALLPEEQILQQVLEIKKMVAKEFHSKGALRSPAHITLHMPFQFDENKEKQIADSLKTFASEHKPVHVHQEGFEVFEPRVIFINVHKSEELSYLQSSLLKHMRLSFYLDSSDYKNRGFHPHMTVAFRDLKKPDFYRAWEYFQKEKISYHWVAKELFLLKHYDNEWNVISSFPLGE